MYMGRVGMTVHTKNWSWRKIIRTWIKWEKLCEIELRETEKRKLKRRTVEEKVNWHHFLLSISIIFLQLTAASQNQHFLFSVIPILVKLLVFRFAAELTEGFCQKSVVVAHCLPACCAVRSHTTDLFACCVGAAGRGHSLLGTPWPALGFSRAAGVWGALCEPPWPHKHPKNATSPPCCQPGELCGARERWWMQHQSGSHKNLPQVFISSPYQLSRLRESHLTALKTHCTSKEESPTQNKQAFPGRSSLSKDFVCCSENAKAIKSWISGGWRAWTNEQNAHCRHLCVCE